MPLLVPAEQLEAWRKREPSLWIEAMPTHILLDGRALMPKDLTEHEDPQPCKTCGGYYGQHVEGCS